MDYITQYNTQSVRRLQSNEKTVLSVNETQKQKWTKEDAGSSPPGLTSGGRTGSYKVLLGFLSLFYTL